MSFKLRPEQEKAVELVKALVARGKSGDLVGGPGTGRSVTVKAIVEALSAEGAAVQVVAPTGLSIRKLILMGVPAKGVHELEHMPTGAFDLIIVDSASVLNGLPPEDQQRISNHLNRVARATVRVVDGVIPVQPPITQASGIKNLPVIAELTTIFRQR